ncbi:dicarboxylate/amino acid:cation symporter [Paraburkholderia xenovorans]|uniref:dicarboxylate/amino acid:cation symporter n=1 Tax=Paraburkholderia xenovorans TaxID=36873 RepID=UPI0038BA8C5D
MKHHRLSALILIALVLGCATGYILHAVVPDGPVNKEIVGYIGTVAEVFLRLVKMIIAPLIFAGIVAGMTKSEGPKEIARIGGKALIWFLAASIVSLVLGLFLANLYGLGSSAVTPEGPANTGLDMGTFSLKNLVEHIVPQSVVMAMSQNDIIAILLFAVLFGFSISSMGKTEPMVGTLAQTIEGIFKVMLRVTRYVMYFAPVGVFAAIASAIAQQGIGVLLVYGKFIGAVYSGFALLWCIVIVAGFLTLGRSVFRLLSVMRAPLLVGFSTSSSEAAFPKMIERLDTFGIPNKISTFVLPLAYSFNADGSMMYQAFATVFLLQAYHVHASFAQQLVMLFIMLISSKGSAGVPRGSLVIVAATVPMFGIPASGIVLLLAADTFVDMGRTVTNLIGSGIATAVVAKWEEKYLRLPEQKIELNGESHVTAISPRRQSSHGG